MARTKHPKDSSDEPSPSTRTASPPRDGPSTRVSAESLVDMDTVSSTCSIRGKEAKVLLKGRCTRCWGNLVARHDNAGQCTLIKCRVCGSSVQGDRAADAFLRMQAQTMRNLVRLESGRVPRYEEGDFVEKVFPQFDTLPKGEFARRVRAKLAQRKPARKLTRHDFPPGSPGLLFIQARILLAGVAVLSNPDEVSVADIPDVAVMHDGSLAAAPPPQGSEGRPTRSDDRLWNRMGTTMIESMSAAFACELALKAICLACADEAPKCHDLLVLHDSLPASSQQRIATDYPQIDFRSPGSGTRAPAAS